MSLPQMFSQPAGIWLFCCCCCCWLNPKSLNLLSFVPGITLLLLATGIVEAPTTGIEPIEPASGTAPDAGTEVFMPNGVNKSAELNEIELFDEDESELIGEDNFLYWGNGSTETKFSTKEVAGDEGNGWNLDKPWEICEIWGICWPVTIEGCCCCCCCWCGCCWYEWYLLRLNPLLLFMLLLLYILLLLLFEEEPAELPYLECIDCFL